MKVVQQVIILNLIVFIFLGYRLNEYAEKVIEAFDWDHLKVSKSQTGVFGSKLKFNKF